MSGRFFYTDIYRLSNSSRIALKMEKDNWLPYAVALTACIQNLNAHVIAGALTHHIAVKTICL
ncbi:hypothetical protein [Zymobacter palmae]|uniref:hypothetical protein n=1 Tax=Zymobacter palmae TaxID=33074 RepID=UPI0012EB70F0|nr:hypothetical protein [Zymobacter palmae]